MSYSIFLEPKALVEMQEGFTWYEKQKMAWAMNS